MAHSMDFSTKMLFTHLREANIARCNDVYEGLNQWSPTDWACAMAGECGEACNKVKKLRRLEGGDTHTFETEIELIKQIGEEIADTIIYADLLAARLGIDLEKAIKDKFNKVSKERGSKIYL